VRIEDEITVTAELRKSPEKRCPEELFILKRVSDDNNNYYNDKGTHLINVVLLFVSFCT